MSRRRRRCTLFSAAVDTVGALLLLEGGDGKIELEGETGFVELEQPKQFLLQEGGIGEIQLEGSTDVILLE